MVLRTVHGIVQGFLPYYNAIDIVPKAWADLLSIKSLYSSPGPACPWELKETIDLVSDWLNVIKVSYTQPNGAGESRPGVPASTVPITAPHTLAKSKKKRPNV